MYIFLTHTYPIGMNEKMIPFVFSNKIYYLIEQYGTLIVLHKDGSQCFRVRISELEKIDNPLVKLIADIYRSVISTAQKCDS